MDQELELNKHMLGLRLPTDPRWASIAGKNLHDILVDHAWCEQKAASSGISMIVLFPDRPRLVEVMTAVVEEEWRHFSQVMQELAKRGLPFGRARKDEYVARLAKLERIGGSRDTQLMEKLLLNALIEARSAERFKMLSQQVDDPELSRFYYELMVSEAGHYRTFIDLAMEYNPEEKVWARWQELLAEEAEIIATLEVRADRLH